MRAILSSYERHTLYLHFAICNKMTSEVRYLVENGIDVNAQDNRGLTPLVMCCIQNDETWSFGIATMLLQAGASTALSDRNGRNALMYALIFGRRRIAQLLLKAKDYDLFQKDATGRTAIDYAALNGLTTLMNSGCTEDQNHRPKETKTNFLSGRTRSALHLTHGRKTSASPRKSTDICRLIMLDASKSARGFRSSSEMNVHQFRRLVYRKTPFTISNEQTPMRPVTSSATRSRLKFAELIHFSSSTNRLQSSAIEQRTARKHFSNNFMSWQSIAPYLWNRFSVQHSQSYRASARRLPQTFEEALGIPPLDVAIEYASVTDDDAGVQEENNQNGPNRRSSMPIPCNPSHPSFKLRRRSEAVGMSAASLSKFILDEKNVTENFEIEKERAKSASASFQRQKEAGLDSIMKQRRLSRYKLSELSEEEPGIRPFKGRSHSLSMNRHADIP